MSQLDLSNRAGVSTRHLSFVETGRSQPSRDLLLHLGRSLGMPMRDCNRLLLAAGFAPVFGDAPLDAPEQRDTLAAVQRVLDAHEPWPALVVDRHWNLVLRTNAAAMLRRRRRRRVTRPAGQRVARMPASRRARAADRQPRRHGPPRVEQLAAPDRRARRSGSGALADELRGYVGAPEARRRRRQITGWRSRWNFGADDDTLRFVNLIATFGSAVDATTSELMIETFLPADDADRRRAPSRGERLEQRHRLAHDPLLEVRERRIQQWRIEAGRLGQHALAMRERVDVRPAVIRAGAGLADAAEGQAGGTSCITTWLRPTPPDDV